MSFKVFIASRSYSKYSKETKEYLEDNDCILEWNEHDRPLQENDLLKIISKYDGIIVGVDKVTEKVIKKGEKLKVIAKNGVGVDNIDLKAASEAGICVVNAPGTNSASVADLTVALMLALSRQIPIINTMTKNGLWQRKIGSELWKKKVGIIGTGEIGKGVIKRLKGFECEILAYDLKKDLDFAEKYDVKYLELKDLLVESDYVSLHVPMNKYTKNLLDVDELKLMKKTSFLINTSRGGIVNEDALCKALKNHEIAGAACDKFLQEPPGHHPLFELDNFIATSYIGAYTYETNVRAGMMVAKNLVDVLKGKKPINLVNSITGKKRNKIKKE